MPMLRLFAIWITGQIDISGSKLYQQFWEFITMKGIKFWLCTCVVSGDLYFAIVVNYLRVVLQFTC
jgi:hypothetical protein